MKFSLDKSIQILERTPKVLADLLDGLDENWISNNEGPGTWSPFDILGHLIHGEKTDWIPRMRIILEHRHKHPFPPFDRYAMLADNKSRSLRELLATFRQLRGANVLALRQAGLDERRLDLRGTHPELGEVSMRQLIATWVVHDLNHIAQMSRVLAFQYRNEVGPWKEFLGVLHWKKED